ncbi:MAG: ATP-dependent protease [Candidatus Asgardarchaeum californiense]|nr:MAG: ATP-dependent protease [Candidatus Asgardarchaeum californiense]
MIFMIYFYDLCERYNERNKASIKTETRRSIEEDPDFLDSYLILYQILEDKGDLNKAEKVLDEACRRAIALITDKDGNWPNVLERVWLENRHIIRTILNKALLLWRKEKVGNPWICLGNFLKTNPNDSVEARYYILAIRMNMSFEEFENRFNKSGYYDSFIGWYGLNAGSPYRLNTL